MNPDDLVAAAAAAGGPSVFGSTLRLRPATGWDHPVLRAAVYSDGSRTWNPSEEGSPGPVISTIARDGHEVKVAIVESVEARAHDLSAALRQALADAGVGVPTIELYRHFRDREFVGLIADSWSAPHRIADPYWREALVPEPPDPARQHDWPRFFSSEHGRGLDPAGQIDLAKLLRVYPTSLLFGYDPRAAILSAQSKETKDQARGQRTAETKRETAKTPPQKSGRPRGRLCRSEIVAEVGGLYWRTQSLLRPIPTTSGQSIYLTPDGDWTTSVEHAAQETGQPILYKGENTKTGGGKPSNIGLGDVLPSVKGVPDILAARVTLASYVSLAGIRAIHFPTLSEGDQRLAHELLAAMALAAVLGAERDLHVRSECDLVLDDGDGAIRRELASTSRPPEPMEVTYEQICDTLARTATRARDEGVWCPETIQLVARKDLVKLLDPAMEILQDA